jgi:hypothetical protein
MRLRRLPLVVCLLAAATPAAPQAAPGTGHVQIPVELYNTLVTASDPAQRPRPAPAGYALGNARVTVQVPASADRATAEIHAELTVDVLEDQWVLVPVLPGGTPVDSVTVGGAAVQLAATPSGLAWATKAKGSYAMMLVYRVDAQRFPGGFALPLPVPQAAAISLNASLPGKNLDVTVIPAAGTRVTVAGGTTHVQATVPTTSGLQISWRTPSVRGHSISRAQYSGRLTGDAVEWTAELGVDVFGDATATVAVLPRSVTLSTLSVDGKEAVVLVENERFATLVKGSGAHRVRIGFTTPVVKQDGPPRVELAIPQVPISRFDLMLPGSKELKVTPAASVEAHAAGAGTSATVHVPLTESVRFEWSEAVPGDVKAEARANASVYHAAHAEEGVLYVHALVQYEVSRGATNRIQLLIPPGVQVNRIESASGAVADWRLATAPAGKPRLATVFLNRELTGELVLSVHYDRSLGAPGGDLELPLLRAPDAQRQRGMIALLAGKDLILDPKDDAAGTRVGDNQLPAFVRDAIDKTVAHTFKYADEPPRVVVRARTPDAVAAKFEAQVDTLVSLGDVAVTGSASVMVHVKSGRVSTLQLELPADVNLLSVSAPSLRSHQAAPGEGKLLVSVAFTQEMEGEFRLELAYERILAGAQAESLVDVATPHVRGAEVEQGRIAVEALSAVEVRPATTDELTVVEVAELPQQLVLRTTNPILMAYKYLHAEPAHRLALGLTRHRLAGVQEAVIDRADYRTLYTRDGLQVTTAEFVVRNSRKQFLRLRLPKGATVWSAFVDGKADKPAVSETKTGESTVLVKILNSTAGFPVQLVYATQGPALSGLGSARGALPRPDILVTHSHWDVYVPDGMSYGRPRSNMEVVEAGRSVSRDVMARQLARTSAGAPQALDPLRIEVPAAGVHYVFEKLYANQSDQEAWISVPYASAVGTWIGRVASTLGALLFWVGLGLFARPDPRLPTLAPRVSLGAAGAGLVLVAICGGVYHVGAWPAVLVSLVVLAAAGGIALKRLWPQRGAWLGLRPASEASSGPK